MLEIKASISKSITNSDAIGVNSTQDDPNVVVGG